MKIYFITFIETTSQFVYKYTPVVFSSQQQQQQEVKDCMSYHLLLMSELDQVQTFFA